MATSLSGCVVITGQSSQQLNTIGAVKLTTTACFSQQAGCPDKGNSNTNGPAGFQVLLAYRVPISASPPQTITTTAGQPLSFVRDASYAAELQRLAPAALGQKWAGYHSGQIGGISSPSFTVSPTFALKQDDDGAPFAGPFAYRVVTGARATPEANANAPVDCGSDLRGSQATKTTCVDSPPITELATNLQQATQDLGIIDDPSAQRANRDTMEPVEFQVVYAGKGGSAPTFALSASTDVPGAEAKPHPSSLTPAPGTAKVRVNVRVPPGTPRGSYDVTLAATLNGQTRSRIHEVRIGQGTPQCGSINPTITGTSGRDRLVGTSDRDVIIGYGGNDRIVGRAGNDLICAGPGNDKVFGGRGNDTIAGRSGKDLLIGGHGHDLIIGGPGEDTFKH